MIIVPTLVSTVNVCSELTSFPAISLTLTSTLTSPSTNPPTSKAVNITSKFWLASTVA